MMKKFFGMGVWAAIALGVVGCQTSGDGSGDPMSQPAAGDMAMLDDATAEAGCAKCVYKMAGVTDCHTAVKIKETTYLLEGAGADMHGEVCTSPATVEISGKVEGDKFVATEFEIED